MTCALEVTLPVVGVGHKLRPAILATSHVGFNFGDFERFTGSAERLLMNHDSTTLHLRWSGNTNLKFEFFRISVAGGGAEPGRGLRRARAGSMPPPPSPGCCPSGPDHLEQLHATPRVSQATSAAGCSSCPPAPHRRPLRCYCGDRMAAT